MSRFFDPPSISPDDLPIHWSCLWKLHGSLGWKISGDVVIRTGKREAAELIYPEHLKFDQVTRLPYSALFERLRQFLETPDTLLICSGFSFLDSHICAVLSEALAANAHTAIFAFQYRPIDKEVSATKLASSRPNMSVYAQDGAVINGVKGPWQTGQPPNENWRNIRQTFWREAEQNKPAEFLLGDFANLAAFLSLTQSRQMLPPLSNQRQDDREADEAPVGTEDTYA